MNDYAHAKSLLFSQLGNRFDELKTAVINIDDHYAGIMEQSVCSTDCDLWIK